LEVANEKNNNYLKFFITVWLTITVIHALVLYFIYDISLKTSVADSFVFNVTFALAGYTLWFVIRYNIKDKSSFTDIISQLFIVAVVIVSAWFAISYYTLTGFFPDDDFYVKFLKNSIPLRIITGFFYFIVYVLIYYLILYYEDLQEKLKRETELQNLIKEAELDALKSQINPHFLFNSLNSISSLTITSPEKAREMVIKLSDFLRYSLSGDRKSITTLKNEFVNINRYLDIEKVRFGKRLKFVAVIKDNCLDTKVPSLILQPLVENSIKHGVYNSSEEVIIKISCKKDEDYTIIVITNNFDPEEVKRKGEGIGLKNIKNRLRLIYQRQDLLKTETENDIFKATLKIPNR
jgi:sensor histidine kinase YesM